MSGQSGRASVRCEPDCRCPAGGERRGRSFVADQFGTQYHHAMDLQFTALFRKVPEGYIGFVEELPGANTQAATLEEARANLQEAVVLVLEANRSLVREETSGPDIIRESLKISA